MWRKLPLNAKLIAALAVVQALSLTLGYLWLVHWTGNERLGELQRRLDTQGDAVEGALVRTPDGLRFDATSEAARELAQDKDFYFLFVSADGRIAGESTAMPPAARGLLRSQLRPSSASRFYQVALKDGMWLVQSEPHMHGMAHMAINAQPVLDGIADYKRYVALGALAILFVTSLGTGLVVRLTTASLREFARKIRSLEPPLFAGGLDLAPQSAEEALLFASYEDLIAAVRASAEAQRLFLAHASHELKSPIAAALSALEVTLSRPRTADDYEQTCRDVFGEVTTLGRLSAHLLDLTRLEAADGRSATESCDVVWVARGVAARWGKAAADRDIAVELALPAALPFQGTAEQWEVVLGNLVDNAVKYGRHGGHVVIEGRSDRVLIRDDGRGMTPAQVSRLGELFFRADEARSGDGSFGLGFAHAQRVARSFGASLHVDSREGEGTSVTVQV